MDLVFDIETDDIQLHLWCLVAQDAETKEIYKFPPSKSSMKAISFLLQPIV
jgi:hypothetical protein